MNYELYLKKFNIEKVEHTEEFLKKLQHNHVTTIPYENLDLVNQKLLVLEPEAVFNKIILGKRGGYCFEVNCLLSAFGWQGSLSAPGPDSMPPSAAKKSSRSSNNNLSLSSTPCFILRGYQK